MKHSSVINSVDMWIRHKDKAHSWIQSYLVIKVYGMVWKWLNAFGSFNVKDAVSLMAWLLGMTKRKLNQQCMK